MQIRDPIYGHERLVEPVLIDLIRSSALQRLKGILQHGVSGLIGITSPITRFEHSIGVMILVRRLGASLEEQIAALLHDVSHTAFSHVIDYVVDGHDSQSYHEEKKEEYIAGTDLPSLLAGHGHDWRDFIDEHRFTLLEQPSPRLCADRLDYFFRDSQPLGLATRREITSVLKQLVVIERRIAAADVESARWMGDTFMAADDASWANFREVGLYELTAQAIKIALQIGAISEDDFWLIDEPFWAKLHNCTDADLQGMLFLIAPETRFIWDDESPTFRVSTKLRAIDPDVVVDGRLYPLSVLDADYAKRRENYLTRKGGKWPMRVIAGAKSQDVPKFD